MTSRTIYSTNDFMAGYPDKVSLRTQPNEHGHAVAIAKAPSGRYSIHVSGRDGVNKRDGAAYAFVDRAELRLIYEALGRELADG